MTTALGVVLILIPTVAYNGSAVLLAVTARRHSGTSSLLVGRAPGLIAISLAILGWVLEVAAPTMISLTLTRIINVAGLGILLGLTGWILKEPLGSREILSVSLIALGMGRPASPLRASVIPLRASWSGPCFC